MTPSPAASAGETILQVEQLVKVYPGATDAAVNGLEFSVRCG